MRLGLTLIDPASVNNNLPQYAMPNLVRLGNTWILAITRNQTIWDNFDGGLSSTYTSLTGEYLLHEITENNLNLKILFM